jgi:hypothetical protein
VTSSVLQECPIAERAIVLARGTHPLPVPSRRHWCAAMFDADLFGLTRAGPTLKEPSHA